MLYVGPLLYLLFAVNLVVKYYDDTNLLYRLSLTLISLRSLIMSLSAPVRMKINLHKTMKIVFRQSDLKRIVYPLQLEQIEQLCGAKRLTSGCHFKCSPF